MSEQEVAIGLFYGSTTCYTEMAAEKIQAELNTLLDQDSIQLFNIKDTALKRCEAFDIVIFGISTWDFGELQEDWESCWQDIRELDLNNKIVALYGLGDQIGYADWYQDALGMLHDEAIARGCQLIGYWPNQGYQFTASKGLTSDQSHFVGLALDDENQYEQTEQRIQLWCQQLLEEINQL